MGTDGVQKPVYSFRYSEFLHVTYLLRHSDLLRYSATVQYMPSSACVDMTDVAASLCQHD